MRGVRRPAFALVLSTDCFDAGELATAMTRELGATPWAGCCAAGVFAGTELLEHGVVAGVVDADDAAFGDAREAGRAAVAEALASLPPDRVHEGRAFLILPDTLAGSAAEVIRGAVQEAGAGAVWAGGGVGDNLRVVRTAQLAHGRAWRDRVVVVAIASPEPPSVGIRHGWQPYGPPTMVTRAHGAIAEELEYESAFENYRRTAGDLGDAVDELRFSAFAMTHPLGIPQADGDYVIRDPLRVEPGGGLRCVAEVPEGSMVRVMYGDQEALLRAAERAARDACAGLEGDVGGAFVFDCVSRYRMLGRGIREELAAIHDGVGRSTPMMGCLTLGELGAMGTRQPQFHNKTTVVMALPGARSWAPRWS
jgi:hypothetical protein